MSLTPCFPTAILDPAGRSPPQYHELRCRLRKHVPNRNWEKVNGEVDLRIWRVQPR